MVGDEVVANFGLVNHRRVFGLRRASCHDCFGGQAARQQCLPDAFSGHHVGCHRGVTCEQHTAAGERGLIDLGGNRPCGVTIFQLEVGSEGVEDVRPTKQIGPLLLHVLYAALSVSKYPETDVDATAGQGERPGIAGDHVRLEPDIQLILCRPSHIPPVLPEAMPFTQVTGLRAVDGLSYRAPHPVGGDHISRRYTQTVRVDNDLFIVLSE